MVIVLDVFFFHVFVAFLSFSLGRPVLYNVFMVFSPPQNPGQNPDQKSGQKIGQKIVRQIDRKLLGKQVINLQMAKILPQAPPEKPEIANKSVRARERFHFALNLVDPILYVKVSCIVVLLLYVSPCRFSSFLSANVSLSSILVPSSFSSFCLVHDPFLTFKSLFLPSAAS